MKKWFQILLMAPVLIALCFALAACAGDAESQSVDEDHSITESSEIDESSEIGLSLGTFTTTDLAGNKVTEAVFAEKDVTILNVWGTYCGPCHNEMPDLSNLDAHLPDNAQIIGVVIDVPEGDAAMIKTAKKICKTTNVTYTNILMNDSVADILQSVTAIPTTFILDSEGKMVCKPFIGAYVNRYKAAVQAYLNEGR